MLSPKPRPLLDAPLHAYAGFAFTTIFCALVLACGGLLWCAGALAAPLLPAELVPRLARAHFWLLNAGVGATAALLLYGHTLGPRALGVTRLRVRVPGLPPAFAGFRIVHVSDFHIGPHLRLAELARHVARVNALDPDLVCVTGDLVDRPETCAVAFPTLARLSARHGVLVTLGNLATQTLRYLASGNTSRRFTRPGRLGMAGLRRPYCGPPARGVPYLLRLRLRP